MGATSEMYRGAWRTLPNAIFLDWPTLSPAEIDSLTIPPLAAHLIRVHSIQPGDAVLGSSLGGMVACEIANQLDVGFLGLIGSATHPSEVSDLLAALHPLDQLGLSYKNDARRRAAKSGRERSPGKLAKRATRAKKPKPDLRR